MWYPVTRDQFVRAVREAATYRSEDLGGEGTSGYLLSEEQFAVIFAAGDEYAAHEVEACAHPPFRAARRPPGYARPRESA